jgi:uncharacterized membrane protein YadS
MSAQTIKPKITWVDFVLPGTMLLAIGLTFFLGWLLATLILGVTALLISFARHVRAGETEAIALIAGILMTAITFVVVLVFGGIYLALQYSLPIGVVVVGLGSACSSPGIKKGKKETHAKR